MDDCIGDKVDTCWTWYLTLGGKSLTECIGNSYLSILISILCLCIISGHIVIALNMFKIQQKCIYTRGIRALQDLIVMFILNAICGYGFFIIKMVYPLWTLYVISLIALAFYTWRYIYRLKDLDILYNDVKKFREIKQELGNVVKDESIEQRINRVLSSLDNYLEDNK